MVRDIDDRTKRIERALYVNSPEGGPPMIGRIRLIEEFVKDEQAERALSRVMVAISTLIGSAVGAVAAVSGWHR